MIIVKKFLYAPNLAKLVKLLMFKPNLFVIGCGIKHYKGTADKFHTICDIINKHKTCVTLYFIFNVVSKYLENPILLLFLLSKITERKVQFI